MLKNKKGQGMVEYILILVLVVILGLVGLKLFGGNLESLFQRTNDKITNEVINDGR